MKFTLSWLKDHLETEASLHEVVDALNKLGLEVRFFKEISSELKSFIAAKVIKIEKHKKNISNSCIDFPT